MLKSNLIQDFLGPQFDGPFTVLHEGPDVKLYMSTQEKWVHFNHCRKYSGTELSVFHISPTAIRLATDRKTTNFEATVRWEEEYH